MTSSAARTHPNGHRFAASLAAITVAVGLAACQSRPEVTGSIYPSDTRDRHPIMLTDGARVLDVFVEGPSGLSARERDDVAAFVAEYRRYGSGPLIAQVPAGQGTNPSTQRALLGVREAAGYRMSVSHYQPADPRAASPIRLSFRRLQAKVASQCGLWPQDLGVDDVKFSWRNDEYWNFGCAARSNFAAQVAEPADLVRGRRETAPDTGRRMYNFGQIRQGQDPSTTWKQQDATTKGLSSQ